MKKAKIMLITIPVVALVGGVLAFNAKKNNPKIYCTTTLAGNACNTPAGGGTFIPGVPSIYYTIVGQAMLCAFNPGCEGIGKWIPDTQ